MSFIPINADDFVISSDSVTTTLWSNNLSTLSTFSTPSELISNNIYLPVYGTSIITNTDTPQFTISYGHANGTGSAPINPAVSYLTPTRITYGQFRTLINGDENTNFSFGTGNNNAQDIIVLNISRANYKEKLFLSTFNLSLSGSTAGNVIKLTNNSSNVTSLTYCDAGRVFDIVSGSNGSATNYTPPSSSAAGYTVSGSYGKFLPDVGLILLNPKALALTASQGGLGLSIPTGSTSSNLATINTNIFNAINAGRLSGGFSLNSEETITSDYIFVRIKNSDFNYTTNPSIISGSGDFNFPTLIDNPQTYITTVGLYNDLNELIAVGKMSKPVLKSPTSELSITVKLEY